MGSPILLKPQLTYFTFIAICGIEVDGIEIHDMDNICLLYTSPSPRD